MEKRERGRKKRRIKTIRILFKTITGVTVAFKI